jgi:hypothetical protein
MILFQQEYIEYLDNVGVGKNDKVASSIDSYVSYLRSVSKILDFNISPSTVAVENDIKNIFQRLHGKRADKTLSNYCSALRQYAHMVQDMGLK